ncbi:hypothetical protein COT97_01880 [Candidatus Falkowbacteria bacterium CG10_big_fil_rev_8_21_14_0_10_39_11]|uniref:Uncharacterized protein n=1 Tax=Candidatus Falkowbacteria bacterium CG10_big_fil_rev_8_21_14_0_10_39_11 TaxID=1974565 RepID=A0A2H0V5K2_9BACT|nr:MAG: hypothetical protein COT97_01880 [Candidatus Falkowbacteria bacterium CG10_big_fil_rev_8_21_14_0_10_39_11]
MPPFIKLPPLQPAEKKMVAMALRDIKFATALLKQAAQKMSLFGKEHGGKKKKFKDVRSKIKEI